jgi:hypothetical protein
MKPGEIHPSVIILSIKNERKLQKIANELKVKYRPFFEPDIGNQLTAIATEPISGEDRNMFRKYNLIK